MITQLQKDMLGIAVQALKSVGITAWFEARIIKDSSRTLNGKRISSLKRTDLESVLAVADKRRVGMLSNMRLELRMYATVVGSRSVFMGQELTTIGDLHVPKVAEAAGRVIGVANYSPSKNVERLRAEGLAEDDPLMLKAKSKVVLTPKSEIPRKGRVYDVPFPPGGVSGHTDIVELVPPHTCDTNGPMMRKSDDGPFYATCSLCGEYADDDEE